VRGAFDNRSPSRGLEEAFKVKLRAQVEAFGRRMRRALAIRDAKERERRVQALRDALRKDYGWYYVREYTVREHFRVAKARH